MESIVKKNQHYIQGLLDSLQCGINKAKNGSKVEDIYVIEKAVKLVKVLGLEIKQKL